MPAAAHNGAVTTAGGDRVSSALTLPRQQDPPAARLRRPLPLAPVPPPAAGSRRRRVLAATMLVLAFVAGGATALLSGPGGATPAPSSLAPTAQDPAAQAPPLSPTVVPPSAGLPVPLPPASVATSQVSGTVPWTDSGLRVRAGDRVGVRATGDVRNNPDGGSGPDGVAGNPGLHRFNVIQGADHGALLARIGPGGEPFLVGSAATFSAPASGALEFGVNDTGLDNNSGAFTVHAEVNGPVG